MAPVEDFLQSCLTYVGRYVMRAYRWLADRPMVAGVSTSAIAYTTFFVFNSYWNYVHRDITLFVGSPGSTGYRMRNELKLAIEAASPIGRHNVQVEIADGYEDIATKVANSGDRLAIGLTAHGSDPTGSLRVLLPLDWDYLHVVARSDFLQSLNIRLPKSSTDPAVDFAQVVGCIKPARVYAGRKQSGTRRFAKSLFMRHGRDLDEYLFSGIEDFAQLPAALRAGSIDVAFFSGPLEARTMLDVRDNGSGILLGIKSLQDALIKSDHYAMVPTRIPAGFYSAVPFDNSTHNIAMSAAATDTIAVRRVVVVSDGMSTKDAHAISNSLLRRLSDAELVSADTWWQETPDWAFQKSFTPSPLNLHPGARAARDGVQLVDLWNPFSWPKWLWSLAPLVIGAVFSVVAKLRAGSDARQQPTQVRHPEA